MSESEDTAAHPSFGEAVRTWAYVGVNSFGGPAGQIAVMHKVLVDQKRWISEERFLHALNYCMLLPGPEAQQLAVYIGWLLHGARGGLVAGTLFVLPGAVTILVLSYLYTGLHDLTLVTALFFGLKAAVLAIVVEAVQRIGKRALKTRQSYVLATLAFVAIFVFNVPFPLIVLAAGLYGFAREKIRPWTPHVPAQAPSGSFAIDAKLADAAHGAPTLRRSLLVLAAWGGAWAAPVLLVLALNGPGSVYFAVATFFSKAAVVTFGGAYSVLAYIAQQAVHTYHWLQPGEMLDGLAMAETTPGPLIMVVQFVGFLAAYRNPGALPPMLAATLAALLTTWVTFAPCFLWIFLGAPYIEALRHHRGLNAALSSITAAVVGVILNLAVWFALHTLFGKVDEATYLGARLYFPQWSTLDWSALALAVFALLATFRFHVGTFKVLAACAAGGIALRYLFA